MISSIINIALSGLRAAQIALNEISNNIANAENPKYCRRSPVFRENSPIRYSSLLIGQGVKVTDIKREYNKFFATQWQKELSLLGDYEVKKQVLGQIETIFNEADGGLSNALTEFWSAWEDLSYDPTSMPNRETLINKTQILIENFHQIAERLHQLHKEINGEIEATIADINKLTQQIAGLNKDIKEAGGDVDSLYDERDSLIRELSEKIDITVFEEDKEVKIFLDGCPLVEGNKAFELKVDGDQIVWNSDDVEIDITSRIKKGELGAYLRLKNEIIPEYIEKLDNLAYHLVNKVNEQHKQGYGLDNSHNISFFIDLSSPEGAARDIELNSDILDSPNKIAASSAPDEPSNNENALAILGLKDTSIPELNDTTFEEFYSCLIAKVGNDAKEASSFFEQQKLLVDEIRDKYDSISGVSLDEEAVNLLKFQYMYDASARLISVADEMIKTLINLGV